MKLKSETIALLDDLEARLDPETEEDYRRQWENFIENRVDVSGYFHPCRKNKKKPGVTFPQISINDALADYETMLCAQLAGASAQLAGDGIPSVRANYGPGILSSLFGAEIYLMDANLNCLPTTRVLGDGENARRLVEAGIPNLETQFGRSVFEMGEFFNEAFSKYPKIQKYVSIYHPDLQGPLDIAELLFGGELFYLMYDDPQLLKDLLQTITDTYTAFMKRWFALCPPYENGINDHWGSFRFKGELVLRLDSGMNISPEQYLEFSYPYDAQLLETFHGGVIHFCGRGDHYCPHLATLPGLFGVNLSQPHLNDMESVYRSLVDRNIKLVGFNRETALCDQSREGGFHGQIHC